MYIIILLWLGVWMTYSDCKGTYSDHKVIYYGPNQKSIN